MITSGSIKCDDQLHIDISAEMEHSNGSELAGFSLTYKICCSPKTPQTTILTDNTEGRCIQSLEYWQNHNSRSSQSENTWPEPETTKFPCNEEDPQSKRTWLEILLTPAVGDPWLILAQQYIVAHLNQKLGRIQNRTGELSEFTSPSVSEFGSNVGSQQSITSVMANAATLLRDCDGFGPRVRNRALFLAHLLSDYNNGLIGPEMCEQEFYGDSCPCRCIPTGVSGTSALRFALTRGRTKNFNLVLPDDKNSSALPIISLHLSVGTVDATATDNETISTFGSAGLVVSRDSGGVARIHVECLSEVCQGGVSVSEKVVSNTGVGVWVSSTVRARDGTREFGKGLGETGDIQPSGLSTYQSDRLLQMRVILPIAMGVAFVAITFVLFRHKPKPKRHFDLVL